MNERQLMGCNSGNPEIPKFGRYIIDIRLFVFSILKCKQLVAISFLSKIYRLNLCKND